MDALLTALIILIVILLAGCFLLLCSCAQRLVEIKECLLAWERREGEK